ncbi:exodeoxyribonuclease III [Sulfurospirillum multivorans]|uniref:Exodeoxyribonuclease III n=2 Tax=Sulfurospirillum multivorans TaxID=66821 RepID=A0AA86AMA3_SULMK|nr:exodeoxyribonuclease III [Sulfurospirillum multivorans]AHJ13415.1 exodeoxyribonuclease III [Sulfurospirillum multivorans DSM 12446]QEH06906.1 exodeoxyribonuclease III [Sulfurospirillum multivorans]
MKLISWNVNGIRAVANKNAFAWVDEFAPNVLCLQEIKAEAEQIPEPLFSHTFTCKHVNSASKKGYSGTMSFSTLPFEKTDTAWHIDHTHEGRILEHHFGDVALFNVYFPNGQQSEERLAHKLKFYSDFLAHTEALRKEGKGIIICGDVNTAHRAIDLKNPKANEDTSGFLPIERAWIDRLLEKGYIDTFRHIHGDITDAYSWWSYRFGARERNVGWRIDYFFISKELEPRLRDAFILSHIGGSDHCPVGIEIDL